MDVVEGVDELRRVRAAVSGSVGFVPTMGALHDGHAALLRAARASCDTVVASIFVNPTQFGPGEDYESYPRELDADLAICRTQGVDVVFVPAVAEIYAAGATTTVDPGPLATVLEGAHRPGHFVGVATVVAKLFAAVRPQRAFFGQKDAQQLRVIERLAADLLLDVEIVPVPTVREEDGLALSSRNAYLNENERRAAAVLFRALSAGRELVAAGERDARRVSDAIRRVLDAEPLARPEYVAIVDPATFEPRERIDGPSLACLAVAIGPARLIDNMRLDAPAAR